ncbi:MAG: hypothetical protein LiPW30_327 [Parcubacteria group bacterium LiPW_30]|nr:MAG: hypothetical protein LiPW30_327 [Parcubacteria group bacterium LiPW_30]
MKIFYHIRNAVISIIFLGSFFILPSLSYAVSGTCSYHGGVNCSAGFDWDGSAICNDGWRDSSELYSQVNGCSTDRRPLCTSEEVTQLQNKYGLPEIKQRWDSISQKIDAIANSSQSSTDTNTLRNNAIESSKLYIEFLPVQVEYQNAFNHAMEDCYELGAKEEQQFKDNLYKQQQQNQDNLRKKDQELEDYLYKLLQSQQTQPTSQPAQTSGDVCVERGVAHSHLKNSACECDSGYYNINNSCVPYDNACKSQMGSSAYYIGNNQCSCSAGYIMENSKCVPQTLPVNNNNANTSSVNTTNTVSPKETVLPYKPKVEVKNLPAKTSISKSKSLDKPQATTTSTTTAPVIQKNTKPTITSRIGSWLKSLFR